MNADGSALTCRSQQEPRSYSATACVLVVLAAAIPSCNTRDRATPRREGSVKPTAQATSDELKPFSFSRECVYDPPEKGSGMFKVRTVLERSPTQDELASGRSTFATFLQIVCMWGEKDLPGIEPGEFLHRKNTWTCSTSTGEVDNFFQNAGLIAQTKPYELHNIDGVSHPGYELLIRRNVITYDLTPFHYTVTCHGPVAEPLFLGRHAEDCKVTMRNDNAAEQAEGQCAGAYHFPHLYVSPHP